MFNILFLSLLSKIIISPEYLSLSFSPIIKNYPFFLPSYIKRWCHITIRHNDPTTIFKCFLSPFEKRWLSIKPRLAGTPNRKWVDLGLATRDKKNRNAVIFPRVRCGNPMRVAEPARVFSTSGIVFQPGRNIMRCRPFSFVKIAAYGILVDSAIDILACKFKNWKIK